jgi:hypothetical protein
MFALFSMRPNNFNQGEEDPAFLCLNNWLTSIRAGFGQSREHENCEVAIFSDHVQRAVIHILRDGSRWRACQPQWERRSTIYDCWSRRVGVDIWAEGLERVARKL